MSRAIINVKFPDEMTHGVSEPARIRIRTEIERHFTVSGIVADIDVKRCGCKTASPDPSKVIGWVNLEDIPLRKTHLDAIGMTFLSTFGPEQSFMLIDGASGERLEFASG